MRRIASLLMLVGVAACSAEPDPRGVKRDEVLLQVQATGRGEARPDEARFAVGFTAVRPTAEEAGAEANRIASRINEALARLGVKPDDLQTRNITLQRIDYGRERGRFRAENLVEVRMSDPAKAGAAIAAATGAGGNVVSGPDLSVRDPERAYNAAYAAAFRAARARADAYAEAAGLEVKRVLVIRDGEISGGIPMGYGYGDAHARYGAATAQAVSPESVSAPPVNAGLNVREVRIRADFALGR